MKHKPNLLEVVFSVFKNIDEHSITLGNAFSLGFHKQGNLG
jgi:hypothetical protein